MADPIDPVQLGDGRLLLRPPAPADVDAITEACQDAETQRWTSVPVPYRREDSVAFVTLHAPMGWSTGSAPTFVVTDAANGGLLGTCGLHELAAGAADVGLWVSPSARNRGVGTDSARLLCRWALDSLRLERLTWWAQVGNWASRRVADNLGFTFEAAARKALLQRGQRRDGWCASLLAGDVLAPTGRWLPEPDLRTTRLRIRPWCSADVESIRVACQDPVMHHWLVQLPDPYTEADARAYLAGVREEAAAGRGVDVAAVDPAGALVGAFSIHDVDRRTGSADIGYWVAVGQRNRGYATEAVRALTDWAFAELGLHRMRLLTGAGNRASERVAESAGFGPEGVHRDVQPLPDGSRRDLTSWARLR